MKSLLYDKFIDLMLEYDGYVDVAATKKVMVAGSEDTSDYRGMNGAAIGNTLTMERVNKLVKLVGADREKARTKKQLRIITGSSGVKPNISVHVKQIPNDHFYDMTVTVKNWQLPRYLDVRSFKKMTVRMGYRSGGIKDVTLLRQDFTCPVFSATCSEAIPNQTYVFHGVIVGESGISLFARDQPVRVLIHQQDVTLEELASAIAKALSLPDKEMLVKFEGVPEELRTKYTYKLEKIDFIAESAYSVASWFASQIQNVSNYLATASPSDGGLGYDPHLFVVITQNEMRILGTIINEVSRHEVVQLDSCKSLSFTGPLLTMNTVYIPNLLPGTIFSIPTNVYSDSPNAKVSGQLTDTELGRVLGTTLAYFRVVTTDVQFGSVEHTNNMTVTATPLYTEKAALEMQLKAVEKQNKTEEAVKNAEKATEKTAQDVAEENDLQVSKAEIGTQEPLQEETIVPKDFYTIPYTANLSLYYYVVKEGDTLSDVYRQLLKEANGGTLPYLRLTRSDFNDDADWRNINYKHGDGIPYTMFFPLIMWATYGQPNNGVKFMWSRYNNDIVTNPDYIIPKTNLAVPVSFNPKSLVGNANAAKLFEMAREWYILKGEGDYAMYFEDIITYIKKGKAV